MHQNQIGLLLLLIYAILAFMTMSFFFNKLKIKNVLVKIVVLLICCFIWIYGFGVLVDLLIKDT